MLKVSEAGLGTAEWCRISTASVRRCFNARRRSTGGKSVSEKRRLKQLQDENRKLKQMVAEVMLDKPAWQAVLSKTGTMLETSSAPHDSLPIR
jgi:putative transposase